MLKAFYNARVFLCLNGYFQQETGVNRLKKFIEYNFASSCMYGRRLPIRKLIHH
jgi:hypothetical protein